MTRIADNDPRLAQESAEVESSITPEMRARFTRGKTIGIVGLAGFFPSVALAVFWSDQRFAAAMATLFFFIVWKVGKTIMKLNSVTA